MVTLETVEIPGYRDAVRREERVRDSAFLNGKELLCGVVVRPLCLRTLILLEQSHNGFFVRYTFDDEREKLAHALQAIYMSRPEYTPPDAPRVSFYRSFMDGLAEQLFIRRLVKSMPPAEIVFNVAEWINEAFMDAPSGGGNDAVRTPGHASYPVYIFDRFAEAGFQFGYDEVMEMPLKRLWQYLRIANRRLAGVTLTNPSDQIAVDFLAKVKA